MALQNPQLYARHIIRTAGSANLTSSVAAAAGFPITRLLDDQAKRLFKFSTSAANHTVTIDQTAAPLLCDAIIIPAGHNLGGEVIEVRSSADPASWPGTLRKSFTAAAGTGIILNEFSAFTADHIRIQFTGTGQFEFGELVLTLILALVLGPVPRFSDFAEPNFGQARMLSGEVFRNIRGSAQRAIEIEWNRLGFVDQLKLDLLASESQNGVLPVYFRSPYDDKADIPVRIIDGLIRREQDSPNPGGTGMEETLTLRLREALE